jgi:hypothetical protein
LADAVGHLNHFRSFRHLAFLNRWMAELDRPSVGLIAAGDLYQEPIVLVIVKTRRVLGKLLAEVNWLLATWRISVQDIGLDSKLAHLDRHSRFFNR